MWEGIFAIGSKIFSELFGSSSGKSAVEQAATAYTTVKEADKEEAIKQEVVENQDADSARKMVIAPSHNTSFDVFVDGWSRMIRPLIATWAFMVLVGLIKPPVLLDTGTVSTVILSIISFYFSIRVISTDIPRMVGGIIKARKES